MDSGAPAVAAASLYLVGVAAVVAGGALTALDILRGETGQNAAEEA